MYNLNTLKELSAPYNSLVAFKQANNEAYRSAQAQGLLSELYPHPTREVSFSEAQVRERASRYQTKSQFKQGAKHHFKVAEELRILDTLYSARVYESTRWSEESLQEAAKAFKTRSEFQNGSFNAYQAARLRGLLNTVCSHMARRADWSFENVEFEALKYKTRSEFKIGSQTAYQAAGRKGWLEIVCKHMK